MTIVYCRLLTICNKVNGHATDTPITCQTTKKSLTTLPMVRLFLFILFLFLFYLQILPYFQARTEKFPYTSPSVFRLSQSISVLLFSILLQKSQDHTAHRRTNGYGRQIHKRVAFFVPAFSAASNFSSRSNRAVSASHHLLPVFFIQLREQFHNFFPAADSMRKGSCSSAGRAKL